MVDFRTVFLAVMFCDGACCDIGKLNVSGSRRLLELPRVLLFPSVPSCATSGVSYRSQSGGRDAFPLYLGDLRMSSAISTLGSQPAIDIYDSRKSPWPRGGGGCGVFHPQYRVVANVRVYRVGGETEILRVHCPSVCNECHQYETERRRISRDAMDMARCRRTPLAVVCSGFVIAKPEVG